MKTYQGQTLSWGANGGVIELELHRDPANEIGSLTLEELEKFAASLNKLAEHNHALILHSSLKSGFSAGADLRELFERSQQMDARITEVAAGVGIEFHLAAESSQVCRRLLGVRP